MLVDAVINRICLAYIGNSLDGMSAHALQVHSGCLRRGKGLASLRSRQAEGSLPVQVNFHGHRAFLRKLLHDKCTTSLRLFAVTR
jgi:hypothetical protein